MHLSAWSEINAGSVIQTALRLPAVHRYAAVPGPFKEQELRSGGVAFEETLQIAVREHLIPDQASGAPVFQKRMARVHEASAAAFIRDSAGDNEIDHTGERTGWVDRLFIREPEENKEE